jgi:8-oxo-dGTP diphosphatase
MDIKTFGKKEEGIDYIWRPAVYCLMFNHQQDKIALIQTSDGKFSPGGGLENNDTHEQCLKREALEGMGMVITVGYFVGRARRYFYSTNEFKYYLRDGYFYLWAAPIEEGHFLKWLEPKESTREIISCTSKLGDR